MSKRILDKQLSIPGLPVPVPKSKPLTHDERIATLESRVLCLELELTLIRLQLEQGR